MKTVVSQQSTITTGEAMGNLMRDMEQSMGSSQMAMATIDAIAEAVEHLSVKNWGEFFDELAFLIDDLENTKPRFSIVIDAVYDLFDRCKKMHAAHKVFNRNEIAHLFDPIKAMILLEMKTVGHYAADLLPDEGTVLIQDMSSNVLQCLQFAKKLGKNISVIVAKQDMQKTIANIKTLHESDIPFKVVPTYMLSSIEEDVDCVLMGALTLNESKNVVAAPGCMQLVSEFHVYGVPTYLLMPSAKFSFWPDAKQNYSVNVKSRHVNLEDHDLEYHYVTYSHDRIGLDMFDRVVTEEGVMTPAEVWELYHRLYAERQQQEEIIDDIIEEVESDQKDEHHIELMQEDLDTEKEEASLYSTSNISVAKAQNLDPDDLPKPKIQ